MGRPAYDPAMMVALLLYAYARGNRSSRAIERECVEDVAYRVIAANLVPDHSTIAQFRMPPRGGVGGVVQRACWRCARGGAGQGRGDRGRWHQGARERVEHTRTVDYQQIAREILEEADRIDREEDELYGEARGDELPEQLRTAGGSPWRVE